jgi:hypothetical protein
VVVVGALSLTWTECTVLGGKPSHLRTSWTGRRPTCSRAHCDGLDGSYVERIHGGGIARWHTLISKRTAGGAPRSQLDAFLSARSDGPAYSPQPSIALARSSLLLQLQIQISLPTHSRQISLTPFRRSCSPLASIPSQVVSLVMHPSASSASSVALS